MVTDERAAIFLHSLEPDNGGILDVIEREAIEAGVPVIRKETQSFLKTVLALVKPLEILEIGTGTGFSALFMREYSPDGCRVTTVENNPDRVRAALRNFRRAKREDSIRLLEGDAAAILKSLDGNFDLIFVDAAKGQYLSYLPEVVRLLAPGGAFISDNVLRGGDILESRYAIGRRDRTIHARMREYLYRLKHHDALETAVIPMGDGLSLSVPVKRNVK